MEANTRKYLQIAFAVVFAIALLRTGYIFYDRWQTARAQPAAAPVRELKSDDFVFLRSLHAYDVASAKKLEGMTVWVKAGNAVAYFKPGERKQGLGEKEAGLLPPIAKLKIEKVAQHGDQVMATFTFADGDPQGNFAVAVGAVSKKNGDTNLILDELFYYEDPHKLFAHWPKDVWAAVERHEITKGMNENQAGAAMGIGRAPGSSSGDYGNRTLVYSHGGKTVEVLFMENSAVRVEEKK